MAPARCTRLAALALLGAAGLWACGSTENGSPAMPSGEADSGAGGSSSDGHAGSPPGGAGDAGLAPAAGGAGMDTAGPAGAGGVAVSEGGAGGMATGSAGEGGACTQHCTTMEAGAFCEQDEVTWVCEPGFDFELFNAQCRDPATALIRYCCPPEFTGECQ